MSQRISQTMHVETKSTLSRDSKKQQKDIILFVGSTNPSVLKTLKSFARKNSFRTAILLDENTPSNHTVEKLQEIFDFVLNCDLDNDDSVITTLKPFSRQIKVLVSRGGFNIASFQKVIPYVPYVKTPTVESLEWAMDKVHTRRKLRSYSKRISPKFLVVEDATKKTIKEIKKKVGLPVIIKPAGLAQSFLIQTAFHEEELQQSLKKVFRQLRKVYKETRGHGDPKVLVEEFFEGQVYSIESFVNSRGKIYFCPLVREKMGREAGYDDFFGYQHIAPVMLSPEKVAEAEAVAEKAIHGLGLRSTTAHVEVIRTECGWKVIEVNPRIGGFREGMYRDVYGIPLTENDVLIRMDRKPIIAKKVQGHAIVFKMYAKSEGTITSLKGIKKVEELKSFQKMSIRKKVGDRATFAKNGGESVMTIWLFNKERSKLLADARRVEQFINVVVS